MPVHPETGVARNMGIAFDDEWNIYLCDNQGWSERPELIYKGRILKLTVDDDGNILKTVVVAKNMEHPNGIRIRDGYMYVTQSYMHPVKREDGKLVSAVYRFALDEEEVDITNTLEDKNVFATFVTQNPECQYGADGIVFDEAGNLYVGNFGDGAVYKITFNEDKSLKENKLFAQDKEQLQSTVCSLTREAICTLQTFRQMRSQRCLRTARWSVSRRVRTAREWTAGSTSRASRSYGTAKLLLHALTL